MKERQWMKIKQESHSLKGSCAYIAANPMKECCKNLQESSIALHKDPENKELFKKVY